MDLVSLETEEENQYIENWLDSSKPRLPLWLHLHIHWPGNLSYTWTSGRLCDFEGCDRPDLQPVLGELEHAGGWSKALTIRF